jgi:manganese efflux pump family protein
MVEPPTAGKLHQRENRMSIWLIIGIALGLSLDAFTVALANSTIISDLHIKHGFRMAVYFGFFQFMMPIIGWAAGKTFSTYIINFDHWIAFGLLAFVGGRMILAGLKSSQDTDGSCDDTSRLDCRNLPTLFLMSIATSIDAMAIGLSFAMINIDIIYPSVIIGLITFAVAMAGYYLGQKLRDRISFKLDLLGGLILIGIGVKILAEHMV